MSGAPFAIDPALASNNNSTTTPATASPANLSKSPTTNPNQNQNAPPSPPKQPNPGYYSILPSLPPLPGWGPFPGPIFNPPGAVIPMYMAPPPHPHLPPQHSSTWPDVSTTATQPALQKPTIVTTNTNNNAHYPTQTPTSTTPKPRARRPDPPPINPAAAASPHYQNPGGFGGVYAPPPSSSVPNPNNPSPTTASTTPSTSTHPHSHYLNPKSPSSPLTTLTSSGRQFACGQPGCTAAFDRKSDCERHRRTHVKGAAEGRPFRCTRVGCEAAFDRKDALMRHERNERTHLVRQTQPGRIKRPTRSNSKSEFDSSTSDPLLQPRRQSTRKRKSLLPNTVDMYASDDEDPDPDQDSDDGEDLDSSPKRARMDDLVGLAEIVGGDVGLGMGDGVGDGGLGLGGVGVEVEASGQLVIDPQLHGLGGSVRGAEGDGGGFESSEVAVETMQAVEAIQAALQQIEADAEKGRVG
ncbi:hypothetical protein FRC09_002617 [Ceratobasidium sp. 395]|nr:hypothetical protein FRC09_002617 [Ceratobasidium sp. 395]